MKKSIFQLYFILLLYTLPIYAQNENVSILDKQSVDSEIKIISLNGNPEWKLPKGHIPIINQNSNTMPYYKSYQVFDFNKSGLPVESKDGWYIVDSKGKVIKNFKKQYRNIKPATDGYYRAYELIPGARGASMIIYLDKKGKEAFKGNKYWKASEFSEGLAIVQLRDKEGPWLIINKKGKKVGEFPEKYSKYIMSANPFHDGMALVTIERPRGYDRKSFVYQKIYFDKKGNEVLDLAKITKKNENNIGSNFQDGVAYTTMNNSITFFNKKGDILHRFNDVHGVEGRNKNQILLDNQQYSNDLFDSSFNPVKFKTKYGEIVIVHQLTREYIRAVVLDTINKNKESIYHIFDSNNLESVYSISERVIGIVGDKVLIGEWNGFDTKLVSIEDFNHKEIHSISPSDRIFKSVKDALVYKDKARYLELKSDKNIDEIHLLKNLKVLKLSDLDIKQIPESIGNLKNLELFYVYDCKNLKELPKSLSKIKSLKKIQVLDCKLTGGLEELILNSVNLTKVKTENYDFKNGFIDKLKQKRPDLRIDNWDSGDIEFINLDVEDDSNATPPSPPPPPKKIK